MMSITISVGTLVNNETSTKHTVITDHMQKFSYSFDWDDIKNLESEPNFYKHSVSEMLHIKKQQNAINAQKDTELLDDAYFNVLDIPFKI